MEIVSLQWKALGRLEILKMESKKENGKSIIIMETRSTIHKEFFFGNLEGKWKFYRKFKKAKQLSIVKNKFPFSFWLYFYNFQAVLALKMVMNRISILDARMRFPF